MRSNGLVAAAYTPIADLDPVIAASLLDDLAKLGIAAYTKPVEPSTSVGFERSDFRVGVRDRLYVDLSESAQVRALVETQDPDLVYDNDDLAWSRLVAEFDVPFDSPVAPWPTQEDIDPGPKAPESAGETQGTASHEGFPFTDRRHGHGWTGLGRHVPTPEPDPPTPQQPVDAAPEQPPRRRHSDIGPESPAEAADDDLFVPDPPPPLPKLAPYKLLAWIAVIAGPALLLLATVLSVQLPVWILLPAVGGLIGGFVTLIATMDSGNDSDWNPGNGAVV